MDKLTPEQQADIDTRVEAFRKDYLEVVKKHECDFVCYPAYARDERGFFVTVAQMIIIDKKYLPTPSPFQKENKIIKE